MKKVGIEEPAKEMIGILRWSAANEKEYWIGSIPIFTIITSGFKDCSNFKAL